MLARFTIDMWTCLFACSPYVRAHVGGCLQVAPMDMFSEVNTGTNLPAQIEIYATPGNEYHFLFIAKGKTT